MTDDPRDALDDALTRGLQSLAPSETQLDADSTLAGMRPRLQRARTHHRFALAGTALALIGVLAAASAVVATRPDGHNSVQTPVASIPDDTTSGVPSSTPTTRPTTTPTTAPHGTTPATSPGTTPDSTPNSAPSGSPSGDNGNVTPGATPNTTPDTSPTANQQPTTKTYTTTGGTVRVRLQNPNVTLVSYMAAPGYTAVVATDKPSDVEVRFSNGENETRVRVRYADGQLREETDG